MIKGSQKSILVMGGSGFIGMAVNAGLLKQGRKVIATYCSHFPGFIEAEDVTWMHWDATTGLLPEIDWQGIDRRLTFWKRLIKIT
jgi:nucleoside-diphosphate-sugar epimerase